MMNFEVEKIVLWLYSIKLTLNVHEMHYMVFHKPGNIPPSTLLLFLNVVCKIGRVFEFRFLGVSSDPSLIFDLQIHDLEK